MLPQASVSPATMRTTRDLLRRRRPLARQRAELLAHVHQTNRQDHLPALGQKIADTANREGVAERWADPAVHKSIAGDLARISDADERLREVARTIRNTATHHDANTLSRLPTVPGIGTLLSRVWRYDIHAINRFPTGQDVVSSGRLVTCAKASAGKRVGTSGTTIGQAPLTWALSAAAVVFRRDHPPAQTDRARVEQTPDQGQALTVLAHQWARAVYDRRKRHVAFDTEQFVPHAWRGADEPGAARDPQGMNRPDALAPAASMASLNAQARIGRETLSPAR
jgi:transposase